jgi:hypothetical protein
LKIPSNEQASLGGLVEIYIHESRKQLSKYETKNGASTSIFVGLTLEEYAKARRAFCESKHVNKKCKCEGFVNVAQQIVKYGCVKLKTAFICVNHHQQPCELCDFSLIGEQENMNLDSPNYTSAHAKRRMLQMPVAAIRTKSSANYLCKTTANITMTKALLERTAMRNSTCTNRLSKEQFKELIAMSDSDNQRHCLRFAIGQATGALAKQMRLKYGVESYNVKVKEVKQAISHVQEIRQGIEHLANIKEKATLIAFGLSTFEDSDPDSSGGSESDAGYDCDRVNESQNQVMEVEHTPEVEIKHQFLKELLVKSQFNWFALSELLITDVVGVNENNLKKHLSGLLQNIGELGLNKRELYLITQSKDAYDEQEKVNEKVMEIAEGIILSDDDESTQPVDWCNITDPLCGEGK